MYESSDIPNVHSNNFESALNKLNGERCTVYGERSTINVKRTK